ncbi:MAG: cupin domain-containing protein [Spirochaetaceae bacterium]|nr:MAG: cupin domain-containing protein [Spirochaetaceae bacterium]
MGFHRQTDLQQHVIGEGRTRVQVHTDRLMMVVMDFTDGPAAQPDPPHTHPHEQICYVVSGRVRYYLGEEYADLQPGDLVTVPAGVPHRIQTLSPVVRLADAFHPIRDDFLAR